MPRVKAKKKTKSRILRTYKKQTGKRKSIVADRKRKALPPSKRISKTGKTYFERRKNRSDLIGKNI